MMATSPVESLSSGFILNIELFFITLLLALPLGLVITFCSMSKFKPLKWLSRTFVWIIRGTPLMLQLCCIVCAGTFICDADKFSFYSGGYRVCY